MIELVKGSISKLNTATSPQAAASTIGQEFEQSVAQVLRQAVHHHQSGEIKAAEELYRAILEIQPDHSDANHNIGVLVVSTQQPDAGLPYLRAALDAEPQREQYWLSYIEALIQSAQPEAAGALPCLQKAAEVAPQDAEVHNNLGVVLSQGFVIKR